MATVQRDSYEMGGRASAIIRHHSCVPLFSFALSVQLIIIYRGTHEWQRINATPQVANTFKRRQVRPERAIARPERAIARYMRRL